MRNSISIKKGSSGRTLLVLHRYLQPIKECVQNHSNVHLPPHAGLAAYESVVAYLYAWTH